LNAANCSFDGNGTSSSLTIQDTTDGRGLGITNAAIVNATNCDFSNNHAVGAVNAGQSQATYLYCSFNNNLTNDGTYVTDQSTAVFRHDTFSGNGPPNIGAVGIEILNSFTGPGVIIRNNTFSNSLGTGVFVGNGTGHQITGNTFSNNGIGILINGYVDPSEPSGPINAAPTITGNTFIVPQGTAGTVLGIYAIGGGAGGVIGGTGALENTFENFPAGNSLVVTNYGGFNPPQKLGFPTTLVLANNYTDCPGPNPKLQNVP
jgi:parallel beta-helix repeat protein